MSKREEILVSALVLFASQGYENIGVQKIVESVNVKKPTLYHYFGSKQGLLEALLNEFYVPFLEKLELSAVYQGDIVKNLEDVSNLYFQAARKSSDGYKFLLSLIHSSIESEARKTAAPYIDKEFGIIQNLFKNAEIDHGNMIGRSFNYTITFQGFIHSHVINYLYGKNNLNEHSAYEVCRQFMYGIFS